LHDDRRLTAGYTPPKSGGMKPAGPIGRAYHTIPYYKQMKRRGKKYIPFGIVCVDHSKNRPIFHRMTIQKPTTVFLLYR